MGMIYGCNLPAGIRTLDRLLTYAGFQHTEAMLLLNLTN
ncbi:hypothetical protein HALA3H3_880018 [Halomonas sp. A3H3]|nr:hypothetical protein HALA3H3_880018 [Halomonas sp. A3H3]